MVATPGRMIDHLHNAQSVGLEELAILVLDEADRLLELGFTKEVHELVSVHWCSSSPPGLCANSVCYLSSCPTVKKQSDS